MNQEHRPGYYRDQNGKWQKDRRKTGRRNSAQMPMDHERRKFFRRKEDQELLERDHKPMIDAALEEFAEDHDGHL